MKLIEKLRQLNSKFDVWSFLTDFFFLVGFFALDWNPILLIVWYMVDTSVMLLFAIIITHISSKDWLDTFAFIVLAPIFIFIMFGLLHAVNELIVELRLQNEVVSDPRLVFNSFLFPIMLICSGLNYFTEFQNDKIKIENNTYKHDFLKHFFLRYTLIFALVACLALFYIHFQIGIIILLIAVKAILRVFNKKVRTIF
ncbi:MAG: hypothetical protein ACJAV5_000133 [Vicingaceae bacterium]|jgi:hypothetical protein